MSIVIHKHVVFVDQFFILLEEVEFVVLIPMKIYKTFIKMPISVTQIYVKKKF